MLLEQADCVPVRFPDVSEPTEAEWAALERLGQALSERLGEAGRRLLGPLAHCQPQRVEVAEVAGPLPGCVYYAALPLSLGEGQLVLPQATAELLLAGLLGAQPGGEWGPLGETEQSLLELWGRECGWALEQVLGGESRGRCGPLRQRPVMPGEGLVVRWQMQLSLGGVSGPLAVEVAWKVLRPQLGASVSQPGGVAAEALQEARVGLEVMFPPQSLTAAELLGLQAGDVIRLGAPHRPVWLRVGNKWIGRGRAGAQGKQLAVSITGLHNKEESDASER